MDYNIFLKAEGGKKTSKKMSKPSKKNSKKPSRKQSKTKSKKVSKGGSKTCPKGQIMREGYTTKTGKTVAPGCITAQSNSGEKTTTKVREYLKRQEAMHELARQKFPKAASKKCPKGYIMREGYKRASYKSHSKTGKKTSVKASWTAPSCIKSVVGKSEKGSKLITIIDKDVLGKYGYNNITVMTKTDRHTALRKAIKANKPLSIYRRIIAIATLNKNKDKKLYKVLREDADWIKTQTEYIVKSASKKTSTKKTAAKNTSKKTSKNVSKKPSKNVSKKTSKKLGGGVKRGSKKMSNKSIKKTSNKSSNKPSKKSSKKPSKKTVKKSSKRTSRK